MNSFIPCTEPQFPAVSHNLEFSVLILVVCEQGASNNVLGDLVRVYTPCGTDRDLAGVTVEVWVLPLGLVAVRHPGLLPSSFKCLGINGSRRSESVGKCHSELLVVRCTCRFHSRTLHHLHKRM